MKYATTALCRRRELSVGVHQRPPPARQGHRRDRRGRRGAAHSAPAKQAKKTIGKAEIEEIVAKIARIPPASVSTTTAAKLQTLERDLKSVVFGQDKAISALASAVKMARSAWARATSRSVSFLFSGPTGVGKTEVAKQLASTSWATADPLRHVGIHGAPCREPPDWRASGLRGL